MELATSRIVGVTELRSVFAGQEGKLVGFEKHSEPRSFDRRLVLVVAESASRTWSIWRSIPSIGSDSVDDRLVDEPDGAAGY